jgi:hypothetical protein
MLIRPATERDVIDMIGQTFPESMRAFVLEDQGELLAIGGVRHSVPAMCFSDIRPGINRSPRGIYKLARKVTSLLDSYAMPVFALADQNEPTAVGFLSRLGFQYVTSSEQGEVFVWPRHS